MPNGKPGDHPYTDIVIHGHDVYSPTIDGLIREIVRLGGGAEISDRLFAEYNPYGKPDLKKMESVLTELRDRLHREAKARGWEV